MRGTIKRVVRDRGFGFIHADDGREIFFHHTSLQQLDFDSLKEERRLSLTWSARRRGREPSTCDPVGLKSLRLSIHVVRSPALNESWLPFPSRAPR